MTSLEQYSTQLSYECCDATQYLFALGSLALLFGECFLLERHLGEDLLELLRVDLRLLQVFPQTVERAAGRTAQACSDNDSPDSFKSQF